MRLMTLYLDDGEHLGGISGAPGGSVLQAISIVQCRVSDFHHPLHFYKNILHHVYLNPNKELEYWGAE